MVMLRAAAGPMAARCPRGACRSTASVTVSLSASGNACHHAPGSRHGDWTRSDRCRGRRRFPTLGRAWSSGGAAPWRHRVRATIPSQGAGLGTLGRRDRVARRDEGSRPRAPTRVETSTPTGATRHYVPLPDSELRPGAMGWRRIMLRLSGALRAFRSRRPSVRLRSVEERDRSVEFSLGSLDVRPLRIDESVGGCWS